ncbi:MAG TPA: hypothetical protein VMU66_04505 [Gaiellales bacterium]|nr:hypothetical protein [Gaiellales bacterium]
MAARRLFGTDGVRGVAGVDLTGELARALGAAAVQATRPGARILIGRDTRESGPELERALVEGIVGAGGVALRAGVLPTPGVAVVSRLLAADLACVISASHNPYRDNGIKFLGGDGRKLADEREASIEAALGETRAIAPAAGRVEDVADAAGRYAEWLVDRYGVGVACAGLLVVDCANGAAAAVAPAVATRMGLDVAVIADRPDGRNINDGVGSTHLGHLGAVVADLGASGGVAFDGDGDRCLCVDSRGRSVDGDAIVAAVALDRAARRRLDAGRVVVTSMTNLGFHRLMRANGIEVDVTDVGDRYVLQRMLEVGATLGGEQSGHVVDLVDHTTGDGLATALMLLAALRRLDMTLDDAAELVEPFPQRLLAVPADRARLSGAERVWREVALAEATLGQDGRVVLRASGTEPVVRVMVEAADGRICDEVCERLAATVRDEIGV